MTVPHTQMCSSSEVALSVYQSLRNSSSKARETLGTITPRTKKSVQAAIPQTETWTEAWATLLESCLYSERAVTLFFAVISHPVRVFLSDSELVSGYLASTLGNSSRFASA